jgi:23S rRNA pseudouridine2605 synthase
MVQTGFGAFGWYEMMSRVKRSLVRLDRALSKLGVASRSEAKRLIAEGRVRVGGRVVRDAALPVTPERGTVTVDGSTATTRQWRTIAFNKPRGVVTTRRDPDGRPTVFDILGNDARSLVAIGRLDMASTGLLLLTTDTQLANYLTDPANAIVRRYVVTVRGAVHDAEADRMVTGINALRASSVVIRKRSGRETHLIVELVEGQNREIRRMLDALGHQVTKLMRVALGGIELGNLPPGEWREVSREELGRLEVAKGTEFTTQARSKRRRTKKN